jgi:Ni/Co efflux regulator RcnB
MEKVKKGPANVSVGADRRNIRCDIPIPERTMNHIRHGGALALAALLGACVVVPAQRRAAPPPPYSRVERHEAPMPPPARVEIRFAEHQRNMAHDYYREEYHRHGRCPPGLEKRRNGCEAPGHARQWRRGEPLPRGVEMRPVPRDLEVRIGPPPRGYRYVQAAGDILMIAIGTAVVVDAIQDINR